MFVILPLVVVVPIRTELREDKADLLERQAQYAAATKRSGIQKSASRSSAAAASRRTSTTKKSSKVSTRQPGITQVQPVEATVSSQAPDGTDASEQIVSYGPENLIDGDATTAWRTSGDAVGETITLSLPERVRVRSVGLIPGYAKVDPKDAVDRFVENGRVVTVVWSGELGRPSTQKFADTRTMRRTSVDITTSVLTLKITGSIRGPRPFTAISDIVVFGSRVGG